MEQCAGIRKSLAGLPDGRALLSALGVDGPLGTSDMAMVQRLDAHKGVQVSTLSARAGDGTGRAAHKIFQAAEHESSRQPDSVCRILQSPTTPNRIALLLRGGAFRDWWSPWCSASPRAFEFQRNTSQSHLEHIVSAGRTRGLEVDIFIATYNCADTNLMDNLLRWYEPNVKSQVLMDLQTAHQGQNMHVLSKHLPITLEPLPRIHGYGTAI